MATRFEHGLNVNVNQGLNRSRQIDRCQGSNHNKDKGDRKRKFVVLPQKA